MSDWTDTPTGSYVLVGGADDPVDWSDIDSGQSGPVMNGGFIPVRFERREPPEPPPPPPEPIPAADAPPPFPVEALPPVIRHAVATVARNKRVPVDLVALQALAAVASLTGPRVVISRGRDWVEPLILHCLTAMESGSGKSPASGNIISPLFGIQARMESAYRDQAAEADKTRSERLDEIEDALSALSRADPMAKKLREEKKQLEDAAEADATRAAPRLMFSPDITPEALSAELSENGGWGAIFDSEGVFFANLAGRYSGGKANLTVALKAYDADYIPGGGRITRIQQAIPRAVLSLGLAVQPGVFADTLSNPAMDEQGFAARFLVAVPASMLGSREIDPPGLDRSALAAWADSLERLAAMPIPEMAPGDIFPTQLELSPAARRMHVAYENDIEPRLSPLRGDIGQMTGWGGKHVGRVLRLAGLLHLAAGHGADQPVEEAAMRAAIIIGNWSIEHAIRASVGIADRAGAADDDDSCVDARCTYVLEVLRRAKQTEPGFGVEPLRAKEIRRKARAKWATAAAMAPVLDQLVERSHLLAVSGADQRGRPWIGYVLNPLITNMPGGDR